MSTGIAQAHVAAQHFNSEAEALFAIGRIACSEQNLESAFEGIAAAVLRMYGMHGLQLDLNGMPELHKGTFLAGTTASAVEAVRANGLTWGAIRIHFDPARTQVQAPVRFARFVGQQIASLLDRLSLRSELETQRRRLAHLERRLATRKAVHRARGQLAQVRTVSNLEALQLMKRHARRSGRTLLQVAEALMVGFDTPNFERPLLRRVHPGQLTSQPDRALGAQHV